MKKGLNVKKIILITLVIAFAFLLYVILGAILPYVRQPKVAKGFVENVDVEGFYSDTLSGERATIIEDNEEALLIRVKLINDAKEKIVLSTFDFHADESGKVMMGALMSAADRGVAVQILVDGFSYLSSMDGDEYFEALASYENIEFKVYNKVNFMVPWKLMARMHDKYLFVDDDKYLLGGRNTYNYFLGDYGTYKNYDRDVLVISNEDDEDCSAAQLEAYFETVWNYKESKKVYDRSKLQERSSTKKAVSELKGTYDVYCEQQSKKLADLEYEAITVPVNKITLLSGPVEASAKEPVIWHTMEALMRDAKERVKIHTPYIICNDVMYDSLEAICNSVESVTLMTNSAPNNGNPFGAGDYLKNKDTILNTGLEVWEYEGGMSYHGKSILIDNRISIIGSFNIDIRSAYLDTEVMVVIDSEEINNMLAEYMEGYEREARQALNDGKYDNPHNVIPVEFTKKRKVKMNLVQTFMGWARFLF